MPLPRCLSEVYDVMDALGMTPMPLQDVPEDEELLALVVRAEKQRIGRWLDVRGEAVDDLGIGGPAVVDEAWTTPPEGQVEQVRRHRGLA